MSVKKLLSAGAAVCAIALSGCSNDEYSSPGNVTVYTTDGSNLYSFNADTPANSSSTAISGLASGSSLVAIDVNPNGGALVGLGSNGQSYTIDTGSGAATAVGAADTTTSLANKAVDIDFNPRVQNVYRVVTTTGDNYRRNGATGARPGTDKAFVYKTGDINAGKSVVISAVAYTNSGLNGGTVPATTTAYVLDTQNQVLAILGSNPANGTAGDPGNPNEGQLTTVGGFADTINLGGYVGFDILGANTGYVIAKRNGEGGYWLHTIDLVSGRLIKNRLLTPDEAPVRGFAVKQG